VLRERLLVLDGHFEGINLSVSLGYLDSYLIRRYVE
jgi:hypothetical protein